MKKTLLASLCLALSVSAALAAGLDTLTPDLLDSTGTKYKPFSGLSCPDGSPAVYEGHAKVGDSIILKKDDATHGGIVSTNSGGAFSAVAIHWGSDAIKGRALEVYGSTTPLSGTKDLYCKECAVVLHKFVVPEYGNYDEFVYTGPTAYAYIGFRPTSSSPVPVARYDIAYDGTPLPPVVPVALVNFTEGLAVVGSDAYLVAHPNSTFGSPVTFAWELDGEPVAGLTGDTLSIDTSEPVDSVSVQVIATDGAVSATNHIVFSIVPTYSITYAENPYGSLSGPASAIAGASVTVAVEHAEGYLPAAFFANGNSNLFAGNVFAMPACDVEVSATFEELAEGDTLTIDDAGFTGTYRDWGPVTKPSGSVYTANTGGGTAAAPSIQIRGEQGSGIVMTWNGGQDVAAVTAAFSTKTGDKKTLRVFGSHVPYNSPADLYDDATAGVLLGTIVNGQSTLLEIPAGYPYVGVCSKKGDAIYLDALVISFSDTAAIPAIAGAMPREGEKGTPLSAAFRLNNAEANLWRASIGEIDEDGAWSWTPGAAGSFQVDISAIYGEDDSTALRSYAVEIADPDAYPAYYLVQDLADLDEGDYLIVGVAGDAAYAMGTPASSGTYPGTPVVDVDGLVRSPATNIVWHLAPNPDGIGFSFHTDSEKEPGYVGYKAAYAANRFWPYTDKELAEGDPCSGETNLTAYGYWQITPKGSDPSDAIIANLGVIDETGGSSNRYAQMSSSFSFTTYKTASKNYAHRFYRLGPAPVPPVPDPVPVAITNWLYDADSATFTLQLDDGSENAADLQFSTNLLLNAAGWTATPPPPGTPVFFIRVAEPPDVAP